MFIVLRIVRNRTKFRRKNNEDIYEKVGNMQILREKDFMDKNKGWKKHAVQSGSDMLQNT